MRAGKLGAGPSDGVEAADEDVLDLRQGDDAAVVVSHRCHVADLGHCDEPSVRRLVAGDAVEEVELARSRQRADLEVLQAPHLEAPGDHRVQAAELHVLGEGLGVGLRRHPVGPHAAGPGPSEREQIDLAARRDQGDPPDRPSAPWPSRAGFGARRPAVLVSDRGGGRRREVQVDGDGVRIGDRGADLGGGRERLVETPVADPDRDDVHRATVVDVLGPTDLLARRRARPAPTGGRGSCSSGG